MVGENGKAAPMMAPPAAMPAREEDYALPREKSANKEAGMERRFELSQNESQEDSMGVLAVLGL